MRSLRGEGVAGQHHLVLPAVQRADAGVIALVNAQARAVAVAPDDALRMGRFQLAVPPEDFAVAPDRKGGAIGGSLRERIALGDADDDIDAGLAGGVA